MIVIAHVSDIHIDDEARSADRTRAVMDYLDDLPHDLDAVIVTGDIADHGLDTEYATARQALASRHPVLVCPGNHDDRSAFRRSLLGVAGAAGKAGAATPVNQTRRTDGYLIALCDSSIPGKDEGHLDDQTLAWLDHELAQTPETTPVLIGFHHPPATLNTPYVDAIRQFGEERLARLVDRYPNIVAFLCGHAHTAAATTFAGRPLLVAPGVVSTLRLPWERRADPEDHVALDQPPSLAFHVLDDEGRLTTHYRNVM
jgi:Icc protein